MLYAFFWVIPGRLTFICSRFGTHYLFHLHRQVGIPAYEDGTECSETSAYKIQMPRNYPEESVQLTFFWGGGGEFSLQTWRMNSSCRKLHDLSIHAYSSGPENVLRTHRTFMHTYGHKRDATDDI